ncbi:MAG TPA: carboxypeptidase-like regulatory domain-containing protein [Flavobacteriales bacterium]|jgi:hypothetical protein
MKYAVVIFLVLFLAMDTSAQVERVVQVSGVVVASDSLMPAPFVTIYRARDHRGTYTDYDGYFTLPAQVGDTLYFQSIGLKKSYFVVPKDSVGNHISIVQWMETDVVQLPTVNILPFPEPHKLRAEILALDLPNDGYKRFSRSMSSVANYDGLHDVSDDATRLASATIMARYNNGFQSGGNVLDAGAWGRFMKALKGGNREDD